MNIRSLRLKEKLSIKELSELVSVDETRLKILERGLASPEEDEIELLQKFFDLSNYSVETSAMSGVKDSLIIGEGYTTSKNLNFKIYEPLLIEKNNKIKVLDLFCGVGGLSYGFEQTGYFSTVGGVDLLNDRIKTFQHNHLSAVGFSYDITKLKPQDVERYISVKPDIIVGGAPCQGFSSIRPFRNLSENDLRNNLYTNFGTYVNYFKPQWFVFENVVGLLTHKNGETLKVLLKEFESIGYKVDFKVMNSAYHGVPQLRERLIIVGTNTKATFTWPEPTHYFDYKSMAGKNSLFLLKPVSKQECLPAVILNEALDDLPFLNHGEESEIYAKTINLSKYQEYLRQSSEKLTIHTSTKHSDNMMQIIKSSGLNIESVRHLVTSGFSTSYSRLESNKPSVTLTVNFVNPSSNKCIHPNQDRALTPREGARIQGFPDKFHFLGSRTQIVKQIGNAVPPILSKVIAEAILKYY